MVYGGVWGGQQPHPQDTLQKKKNKRIGDWGGGGWVGEGWSINDQIRSNANSVWVQSSLCKSDKHHSLPPILHKTDGKSTQNYKKVKWSRGVGLGVGQQPTMNQYIKKELDHKNATHANGLGGVWGGSAPPRKYNRKQIQ